MKLLTFLGIGRYDETTYEYQDQEHTCRFAPAASCVFLKPTEVTVFLTEDAEQRVFPDLRAALPKDISIKTLPISLGSNEQELWSLFAAVSGAVQPGEEVAFDITHGLRSFPLIGLLAAAFLRTGLDVSVPAVLYGAFDVRDQSVTPNRTPMFDLSPMISLLEWSAAADRLNRTGDSRYLASLLEKERNLIGRSAKGNHEIESIASGLGGLASALKNISDSLFLIRPHQVMELVSGLQGKVEKALPALERTAAAQPFNLLLENIVQTYAPLAQARPRLPENLTQTLQIERTMMRWYFDRQQYMQAVSLAREWLVSWFMIQLGMTKTTQHNAREQVEKVVNIETHALIDAQKSKETFQSVFLKSVPDLEKALTLWSALTETRNDIDHAGMRENPGQPNDLIAMISRYLDTIDQLAVDKSEKTILE